MRQQQQTTTRKGILTEPKANGPDWTKVPGHNNVVGAKGEVVHVGDLVGDAVGGREGDKSTIGVEDEEVVVRKGLIVRV